MSARTSPPVSPVEPATTSSRHVSGRTAHTSRRAAQAGIALLVGAAVFSLTACTAEQRAAVEALTQTGSKSAAFEQPATESQDGTEAASAPKAEAAGASGGFDSDSSAGSDSDPGFDLGALVSSGTSSLIDMAADVAVDMVADAGVTPEFKATMDSYEAFMNEYVAFMVTYENSDNTIAMLGDLASLMETEVEWLNTIDAIDETELSDADYAYYIAVTARVTQMMYSSGVF